jgi:NitT/TauT family transport system ATP-binding protein
MSTGTDNIICELRGVSFRTRELQVLENINLTVERDHITAVLGPSGCGKSTLVRILAGLAKPTSGEVVVHGQKLDDLNPSVSVVFQSFALYPWLTAGENIALGLNGRVSNPGKQRELVTQAIDRVGLEGFEEAYPRELSAGMKKRVSIARALVAQPEMLVMDEPFSGLDVLTAENLRTEVINLWRDAKTDPSSVLMVTNNIHEAVAMATRIVVMSSNPGQIRTVLENPLPFPREPHDPRCTAMADRIHEILTTALIPDVPVTPAKALRTGRIEVFPNVTPGEIAGLLERLDADRGRADLFDLSVEIGREFGKLLSAVKAAELLGFVETPKDMAVLTAAGKDYLEAQVNARKRTLNQQLRTLGIFDHIVEMLRRQEMLSLDEDLVLEELAVRLPTEKPQTMFRTIVRWGRYAELFGYNADERKLYLDVESTSSPAQPDLTTPVA